MEETVKQEQSTEKTFNQEELDRIVKERLAREREKYADYDALKEKAQRFDEQEEAQKSELQKAIDRATSLETELTSLKKENEVRTMREKVAKETGVPANLLTASTEEECRALADAIKAYAQPSGYPKVKDGGEIQNQPNGSAKAQFANFMQNIL